ncbi:hypothetical protein E2C01_011036 [Portunus trituberculatus]|uniref:Uncharacterized protein n=1 Tax=Portunus trituberculatus TaxID=210409 RepID=A0A5B7DA13_PORTR|nr:hypothetical protein [Portunus trituberculatus]
MYSVTPPSLIYPTVFNESGEGAAGGPRLQEEKYAVGLTVLIILVLLGVMASVLMCIASRREPGIFEGITFKNRLSNTEVVKLPRRVRFQLPESHINLGFSKALLLSPSKDNEDEEHEAEEGTITICS